MSRRARGQICSGFTARDELWTALMSLDHPLERMRFVEHLVQTGKLGTASSDWTPEEIRARYAEWQNSNVIPLVRSRA